MAGPISLLPLIANSGMSLSDLLIGVGAGLVAAVPIIWWMTQL